MSATELTTRHHQASSYHISYQASTRWTGRAVWYIDYRCDNRHFWLSTHHCQVPTPTSQNLANRTANSNFWSRLTHQLLGWLKSTIPNLQIYLPKKANSEKSGLGIDNPCRVFFFLSLRMTKCLERVNDRHFWNPGVFSYTMVPRCPTNSRLFSSSQCHIYSLWCDRIDAGKPRTTITHHSKSAALQKLPIVPKSWAIVPIHSCEQAFRGAKVSSTPEMKTRSKIRHVLADNHESSHVSASNVQKAKWKLWSKRSSSLSYKKTIITKISGVNQSIRLDGKKWTGVRRYKRLRSRTPSRTGRTGGAPSTRTTTTAGASSPGRPGPSVRHPFGVAVVRRNQHIRKDVLVPSRSPIIGQCP